MISTLDSSVFERGLCPRKLGGRFGRGAKSPSEEKIQRFRLRATT
jgi:hypothetical protein